MRSLNVVNYSLRPNKSIQRSLVFEGINQLKSSTVLEEMIYVGFGSLWFADFIIAHKILGIEDMYSIEADEIAFRRAVFNKPFKTVEVLEGSSSEKLPELLEREDVRKRPWLTWLDYDQKLNEQIVEDVRWVIENSPPNSVLLVTFSLNGIAKPKHLQGRIRQLLGNVVPDNPNAKDFEKEQLPDTLSNLVLDFMGSVAANMSRPGGFIPAFRMTYQDGAPMLTVGGALPTKDRVEDVREVINRDGWTGFPAIRIAAPHLTLKETAVLQSELPCNPAMEREDVRKLGFDLEDAQLRAFESFYRYYPSFAQISS